MTSQEGEAGNRRPSSDEAGSNDALHAADPTPGSLAPDAAFKAIGNATRLAILDHLWGPGPSEPMTFADLRKAVGMRDGSQFNYHLRKLVDGGFIEKVDGGYAIRQAGARVVVTVRTGYLTEHPEVEPFETAGRCYACDGSLLAAYENEMFFVRCEHCQTLHSMGWFPPNALLARTPEAALRAFEHVRRTIKDLAMADICSICNGPLERTVARTWAEVPIRSPYLETTGPGAVRAWYVCAHCGAWVYVTPGESVMDHEAVVDLYLDAGRDVRAMARWELPWTADESCLDVVSEDPLRIAVTVEVDGDRRVLTLDDAFAVVDVD